MTQEIRLTGYCVIKYYVPSEPVSLEFSQEVAVLAQEKGMTVSDFLTECASTKFEMEDLWEKHSDEVGEVTKFFAEECDTMGNRYAASEANAVPVPQ